jgi:hypothetical protein
LWIWFYPCFQITYNYLLSQHINWWQWICTPHREIIGQLLLLLVKLLRIYSPEPEWPLGRIDLRLELALPLRLCVLFPVVEVMMVHVDHFGLFGYALVHQRSLFAGVRQSSPTFFQVLRFLVDWGVVGLVFRVLLRRVFLGYLPGWGFTSFKL